MKSLAYFKKILPIVSIVFLSPAVHAQKKIELKFNPADGSKYVMTTEFKNVDKAGFDMDMNMNMKTSMNCAITSHEANKLMTLQYTEVTLDMDMQGRKMNISSNGTDKNSETLKKMISHSFGCEMDKNGKIIKITGIDSMPTASGQNNLVADYINGYTNDGAIKSLLSQNFSIYPDHPVTVGESWTTNMDIQNNDFGTVVMKAKVTYTLEKVESNLAYLQMVSALATDSAQKIPGTEADISINGTQNGEMVVDTRTGMFTTIRLTQDLKGNVTAMGLKMPMTIKSDIVSNCKKQ